jgi:hypothetical protein
MAARLILKPCCAAALRPFLLWPIPFDALEHAQVIIDHMADDLENPNGHILPLLEGERRPLTGK